MTLDGEALIDGIVRGDSRAIARAISTVERGGPDALELSSRLFVLGGRALVVGVTGAAGTGKSTLVDRLAAEMRAAGKTVGVLGLAFKPETDDMRDSPTIPLIKGLQKRGAKIRAYDPEAMENAKKIFDAVTYCSDAYETAEGADALIIATEWNEFRALKLERVKKLLRAPLIIDLRNVYDPQRMKAEGFTYICVGRAADVRVRERV